MIFRPRIQCPACQGFRCRESRWHSPEEKRHHLGCVPYRCLDCSHRFLKSESGGLSGSQWFLAGMAALFVAVAVAAVFALLTETGHHSIASPQASNVLLDPAIREAAENGDPVAQFQLGEALFQDPARTDTSSAQAVRWLELAAGGGNVDAMIYLGRLSRTGVGILQNFAQASTWIHTAAMRGSSEGMLELGRLYRDGVGVEKDLIKAYAWFNRAAAARNLDAVRERETIARVLTPGELKEAQRQSALLHREGETHRVKSARN